MMGTEIYSPHFMQILIPKFILSKEFSAEFFTSTGYLPKQQPFDYKIPSFCYCPPTAAQHRDTVQENSRGNSIILEVTHLICQNRTVEPSNELEYILLHRMKTVDFVPHHLH